MKGVQEKLDDFSVIEVKPGFMYHEEKVKGSALCYSTQWFEKP